MADVRARAEELKDAFTEGGTTLKQKGEQFKESIPINFTGDDGILNLALTFHGLLCSFKAACLLFKPELVIPGFCSSDLFAKTSCSDYPLVRRFGLQTLAMGIAALGGTAYDFKSKVMLNTVLLTFHILALGDMHYKGWANSEVFKVAPLWLDLVMAVIHATAAYQARGAMAHEVKKRS